MKFIERQAKWLYFASWASIFAAFVTFLVVGFMLFYPVTTVEYLDDRFEVTPLKVKAGETLDIRLRYNKLTDSPATVNVCFVDTIITDAFTYTSLRKAGSYDHWRKVPVPTSLVPGRYYLIFSVHHKVNALRTNVTQTRS
jgi:hypothetical protein